jgi:hypothetical protein
MNGRWLNRIVHMTQRMQLLQSVNEDTGYGGQQRRWSGPSMAQHLCKAAESRVGVPAAQSLKMTQLNQLVART